MKIIEFMVGEALTLPTNRLPRAIAAAVLRFNRLCLLIYNDETERQLDLTQ